MERVSFPWLVAAKNKSDAIRQSNVKLGEDFRISVAPLVLTSAGSSLTHAAQVLVNRIIGQIDYSTTHDVAQYNAIDRLAEKAQVLALPFKVSARSAATIGATIG